MACSLPAAGSLKAAYPDCEITWICDRRFADLPRHCKHIDQVIVLEKKFQDWRKQITDLGKFDAALDLQGLLKSALPVAFSQSSLKLGYHWQREGARLFTSPVLPRQTSIHVVDQYLDVARAAGGKTITDFGLVPDPDSDQAVHNLLAQNELKPKLVICHAGAGWATKRWPAQHFAALADSLADQATIAFIGTQADAPAVEEVLAQTKSRPISLIGKTSVAQLISLLNRADLHIAGDTGSIHIAAALARPCIGLYTLTKPHRSCPYGQLDYCQTTDPNEVIALAQTLLS